MLTFDYLMNIKDKTCIILYDDYKYITSSSMVTKLHNELIDIDFLEFDVNCVSEDVMQLLFENILPSYIIIEDGKILELGVLII